TLIALSGKVAVDGAGKVSVRLNGSGGTVKPLDGGVDLAALEGLQDPKMKATMDDIRGRFASPAAEIVFYSCGSSAAIIGASVTKDELLRQVAKVFQVQAKSFAQPVYYFPKYQGTQVKDRALTSISGLPAAKT